MTDENLAPLPNGVVRIGMDLRKRVPEGGERLFERNPVLPKIRGSLPRVPLECQRAHDSWPSVPPLGTPTPWCTLSRANGVCSRVSMRSFSSFSHPSIVGQISFELSDRHRAILGYLR